MAIMRIELSNSTVYVFISYLQEVVFDETKLFATGYLISMMFLICNNLHSW